MSKTPNLRQSQTGVYKYPTLVLPPMVTLHKQTTNPALPARINQNTPAAPVWTCPAFVESVFDFTLPALRTEAG